MKMRRFALLIGVLFSSLVATAQEPGSSPEPTTVFLVTSGPNMTALYHRQGCPTLKAGGPVSFMSLKDAKAKYFQPHCLCITGHDSPPPCEGSTAAAGTATSISTPTPVAVDKNGTAKSSLVGMTQAQVLAALGSPSLTQTNIWSYDGRPDGTLRVYFKNGIVSETIPSDVQVPKADTSKTATGSYTNVDGKRVQSPTKADAPPAGASARCRDGTYSFSANRRGTCSRHGGVAQWL